MRISGHKRHAERLKRIGPGAIAAVGAAIFAGADIIRAEAAHSITEGSVSGRDHVPSLPGESPNADTRQLDTSIVTAKTGEMSAEVSANTPYAAALEFGRADGTIAERPYMRPATKKKRSEVVELVRRAINKASRG